MNYKLSFTGDLMVLLPELRTAFDGKKYDFTPIFSKVSNLFTDSDYVIGNLETPVANEELKYTNEATVFNTPKEFVQAAVAAGFDCFSLANNHCLDRGILGLNQTLNNLRNIGVDYIGAYDNMPESERPLIKTIGDKKIAFLSYTYGTNSTWRNNKLGSDDLFRVDLIREQDAYNNIKVNPLIQNIKGCIKQILPQRLREKISPIIIEECVKTEQNIDEYSIYYQRLQKKIRIAKEQADLVIMLLHSGGQYNNVVGDYTRNVCSSFIDLGCDIIVVNHPHCVLPFEYINGKLVMYSLGNFCFTPNYGYYYKGVFADYSLVFNLYFDKLGKITKSITVCKVVKENGHSVVYPLHDLISKSKGKRKESLIKDNFSVLKRFFGTKSLDTNMEISEEYFFN